MDTSSGRASLPSVDNEIDTFAQPRDPIDII